MTLTDMSEDIAYKIVKAVCQDKDKKDIQGSAFKPVQGTDIAALTLQVANFPLHAGAVKYFRERGLEIRSELIPPEAK